MSGLEPAQDPSTTDRSLAILIAADNASSRYGGEASLPLHYFRVLESRGYPVHLLVHARVRDELRALYGDHPRIHYVEDTALDIRMWRWGTRLPARVAYFTTGFVSRFATQIRQRRVARELIRTHGIAVLHQPIPVSPKEPSLFHRMGVPVVIGPMNGGMHYPAAFSRSESRVAVLAQALGRRFSSLLNRVMPGKREAAVVLVANDRTRQALPDGLKGAVHTLVENGVDLGTWRPADARAGGVAAGGTTHFVFMGRLVDWKAVDLLIEAFGRAAQRADMSLTIVGDGAQRAALESQARGLGLLAAGDGPQPGHVWFAGWRPQAECAALLGRMDALVLSSLWECGGAVVLEAMAAGLPAIATRWGGPVDYLDEGCGRLIEPASREHLVEGFAAAMTELARDPDLSRSLGEAGRRKIEREFDWERKVDRVLQHYAEAIASARAGRVRT